MLAAMYILVVDPGQPQYNKIFPMLFYTKLN